MLRERKAVKSLISLQIGQSSHSQAAPPPALPLMPVPSASTAQPASLICLCEDSPDRQTAGLIPLQQAFLCGAEGRSLSITGRFQTLGQPMILRYNKGKDRCIRHFLLL